AKEAEGGIQKWKKEKEEKEKEEEEAAAAVWVGEEALRKARAKGPVESKLELHPLLNRWALWFFKNDRSRAWQDNLHLVTKFDTVEDFWAMYNNIQLASKLSSGCDYALFKDGIEPMWEDSRNRRGGRWLLLCLIGESFEEHSREVCGAVINIRTKGDKIAVWTRETENQEGVLRIGRVYKERLGLSTKTIIGYQAHADTAAKSNSLAKNKFV
ncbi:hypothetical protein E2I00_006812, partial [Balaenoptera physalus]